MNWFKWAMQPGPHEIVKVEDQKTFTTLSYEETEKRVLDAVEQHLGERERQVLVEEVRLHDAADILAEMARHTSAVLSDAGQVETAKAFDAHIRVATDRWSMLLRRRPS